ncbi:MAG: type II toxin-antitoxin system death-on-curing family toxin [Pseudomonadota bacterium]
MKWNWVPKETVFGVHAKSLAMYGGGDGLRDEGMLESALGRPENLAVYGTPTVFELSAAYAFGIARNHPFVDGNKRTAFLTAALFLSLNGHELVAAEPEATATMLALASGEASEDEYAAWLHTNSRPK